MRLPKIIDKLTARFRRQQEQEPPQRAVLSRTTHDLFDPEERRLRRQAGKRQRAMRTRNSLPNHRRHHPGA